MTTDQHVEQIIRVWIPGADADSVAAAAEEIVDFIRDRDIDPFSNNL